VKIRNCPIKRKREEIRKYIHKLIMKKETKHKNIERRKCFGGRMAERK
jgi:hypothetical protein